jgi:adenosylcobinamide-phosphate synthase
MSVALVLLAGVLLDALLGEPHRAHPLVAFGRLAARIERRLWCDRRGAGMLAWSLAVLPWVLAAWWLQHWLAMASPWLAAAFQAVLLYLAIGLRSLGEHAKPVAAALAANDLPAARAAVGRIVGRDASVLDAEQVAVAATESVLENGNDAVFGALFWCALLGAPGVVLYRLANTLDAMWGHHTKHYWHFGWAAARVDDVLNFVPARLVALTYGLCGHFEGAWRAWRMQARHWVSPNAGPVMASGAGALGVLLGGRAPYQGEWIERPELGAGMPPRATDIGRAMWLVRRGVALWLAVALVSGLGWWASHA